MGCTASKDKKAAAGRAPSRVHKTKCVPVAHYTTTDITKQSDSKCAACGDTSSEAAATRSGSHGRAASVPSSTASVTEATLPVTVAAESRSCSPEADPVHRTPVTAPTAAAGEVLHGNCTLVRGHESELGPAARTAAAEQCAAGDPDAESPAGRDAESPAGRDDAGHRFAPWLTESAALLEPPQHPGYGPSVPKAVFGDAGDALQAALNAPVVRRCHDCTEEVETKLGELATAMFRRQRAGRDPAEVQAEAQRDRRRNDELNDGFFALQCSNTALQCSTPRPPEKDCGRLIDWGAEETEEEMREYRARCKQAAAERAAQRGVTKDIPAVFALTAARRDARLAARTAQQEHAAARPKVGLAGRFTYRDGHRVPAPAAARRRPLCPTALPTLPRPVVPPCLTPRILEPGCGNCVPATPHARSATAAAATRPEGTSASTPADV